jgi:hypothetical protein
VSYETLRQWGAKFGQAYASQLRRRRPRPGDQRHLDEVFVGINGRLRYLLTWARFLGAAEAVALTCGFSCDRVEKCALGAGS